jgi:chitodextrinase
MRSGECGQSDVRLHGDMPQRRTAWRAGTAALAASLGVVAMLIGTAPSAVAGASTPASTNSGVVSPCGAATPGHETCFIEVLKPKGATPASAPHTLHGLGTWPEARYPADIIKAYDWSKSDVNTGTGKTVAIVDAFGDPTIASNLTHFSTQFSLPACTTTNGCFTKVNQAGKASTYPASTAGWDFETSLDVEYVHAMAPKAHILLVEANTNGTSLYTAVVYAAAHAQYVSMSWGGGEFTGEQTFFDPDFTAHKTVSFFASSGDTGSEIEYPAASPDVVSVGGTTLTVTLATGTWEGESAWEDSGGGCSTFETASTAQKAYPTYDQAGATCAGKRAIPDVSADGNPTTGVAVYDTITYEGLDGWSQVGGTSLAAPLWAAHSASAGVHVNATYVYGSNIPFYDVTTGFTTGPTGRHTCEKGYDICSGLGSWNTGKGTINASPPSAPSNLHETTKTHTSVSLAWTAPSSTGGSPITHYLVYKTGSLVATLGTTLTDTVTGLSAGTTYHFTVKAENANGTSPASNTVAVTTTATAPSAPSNLHETAKSHTSVSLAWTAPSSTGGSPITHYLVYKTGSLVATLGTTLTDKVTGLSATTTYHFTVKAENAVGTSSASNTLTATTTATVPTAPTNLRETTKSHTSVSLAWTAPSSNGGTAITHYLVYATGSLVATLGTTLTDTVTDLSAGTTYHFTVKAENSVGPSPASNTVAVTTTATAPSAPTNLHETAKTHTSVSLAWTAPSSTGGSPITHYLVDKTGSLVATLGASTRTDTVTGLTHATTYHFTVKAENAIGTSLASNTAAVTTTATAPSAPSNLHETTKTHTSVSLAWTAPSSTGGSALTHYLVDKTGSLVATLGPATLSDTVSGLTPGGTYHFTVKAENAVGSSPVSNTVAVTTTATAPSAPGNLHETTKTHTSASLAWTASTSTGGTAITHYLVFKTGSLVATLGPSTLTDTVTGLARGNTYHFTVKAENAIGDSPASNTVAVTITATPPSAPSNLHETGKTHTSVSLAWTAPSSTGGSAITHYLVFKTGSLVATLGPSTLTDTATGLAAGTAYHFTVKAENAAGNSPASGTVTVTTTKTAPSAPTSLHESAKTHTSVSLAWTAPTSTGGTAITHYLVFKTGSLVATLGPSTVTDTVTGLTHVTTYHFTVEAENGTGDSLASNTVPVTTTATPPSAPSNLHETAKTHTSVSLAWTAPSSTGGSPITNYLVSKTGTLVDTLGSSTLTVTVTDLLGGTHYVFTVKAANVAGNSPASNTVGVTTTTSAPSAPSNLHESAKSKTSVSLAWTAPATGGSPITHYLVDKTGSLIATLGASTRGDTVTGLSAGTTYHLTVAAENAIGTGAAATLTVTTTATVPPPPPPPPPASSGYDLVGSDGGVFVLPTGNPGGFYGSLPGLGVHVNDIVGMVPTANDQGYFLVGADGGVFSFGNAPFLGSLPGLGVTPAQPITGIVPTGTDGGYFLVGRDGGVYAFGNAPFLGSLPGDGVHANNIVGIAATPSGNGYWVVAATGTVYAFGAARQLGSATGTTSPVSAIAGTPTGGGYWIVTENGSVDAFGNATYFGSLPALGVSPAKPVIGVVHTTGTGGYWLIGSDGGIFAFGNAGFVGSLPGLGVNVSDIVGAVPTSA